MEFKFPGQSLATTAQILFLLNLLLAPGLAFLLLMVLYLKNKDGDDPLASNHLSQTAGVSLVGGVFLVCTSVLIVFLGGFDSGYTWMIVILYFTLIHSTLILMGVFGFVKALAGEHYSFPVIGRFFRQ